MSQRVTRSAPALVAGAAGALSAGTLALAAANGSSLDEFVAGNQASTWLAGLSLGLVGALVLRSQPGNRLGPVMAAGGLSASVSAVAQGYATHALVTDPGRLPAATAAALAATVLWMPAFLVLVAALPMLFPRGELPSPRWRWPARVAVAAVPVILLLVLTAQSPLDDSGFGPVDNPLDLPLRDSAQMVPALVLFAGVVALGATATVSLLLRMRRADRPERQQDAWFLAAVLLGGLSAFAPWPDLVALAVNVASVAALGVGIVRHGLFDIELVLSRAVVYAGLTAVALGSYFAAAAVVGARSAAGAGPALVAAAVALAMASARARLQRAVDRLLYGDRRDPLAALTRLGDRLGGALDTDDVLPAIVQSVRAGLRLPYAEVRLSGDDAPAYSSGAAPGLTASLPLVHAGDGVGTLVVGLRAGERALAPADARVLAAFAAQAGVAAHVVRVTRELRRSRERVVTSREEERRRIRRDLHDGLGPALAGISLSLETATRDVARHGGSTARLDELRAETAACVDEVRRIVADLRPPSLDEAGLAGALRRQGELLTSRSGGRLQVSVRTAPELPALPPAVEVAAYRIASEAMTNTARHAGATTCAVCLEVDGTLHVSVHDDGSGVPPQRTGTGLTSMRERAEELGGRCTVTFSPGRGTRVEAELPVPREVAQ